MKWLTVFALTCLLSLGLVVSPAGPAHVRAAEPETSWEKVLKSLQGEWICSEEESEGKKTPAAALKEKNRRVTIKGNKLIMRRDEKGVRGHLEGRIELDPTVTPATFDLTGKDFTGVYFELTGIYELKDDVFRLCITRVEKNAKRPKDFTTEAMTKRESFTFKRDKN